MRQGIWLAVCVSVPIWLILWHADAILAAMGQDRTLVPVSAAYVRALQWAILPFYGYIVLRSFISALERPGWALVTVFGAVGSMCSPIGASCSVISAFRALGVVGAGLGTTLSSLFMFGGLALVVSFERRFRRYRLFGRFWRPDWPRFRALLKLGLPIAGIMTFEVSTFNAAALLMGLIDAVSLAAHAIAIQIASISFMVPLGVSQAATVRVGRAYGARSREGVSVAGWTAFVMGVGFMALMGILMLTQPRLLIGAFIDLGDPRNAPVVRTAVSFLAVAALFQVVDGAQAVTSGMLRGLHDTTVPMIFGRSAIGALACRSASCSRLRRAWPASASGSGCRRGLRSLPRC